MPASDTTAVAEFLLDAHNSPCGRMQMLQSLSRTLNKDFGSDQHETKAAAAPLVHDVAECQVHVIGLSSLSRPRLRP